MEVAQPDSSPGTKYDPVALITAFADVVDMLDEKANPTLGCKECHIEASKELSRLRQYPPETKKEAREWLWEFHNSVNRRLGKPTISFTQAAKLNNWKTPKDNMKKFIYHEDISKVH